MLCGSSFGLGTESAAYPGVWWYLRRHRWFETSGFWAMSPPCQHGKRCIGIYGDHGSDRRRELGGRYFNLAEWQQAMGIDWMSRDEMGQAIPLAYTEYIGRELLRQLT